MANQQFIYITNQWKTKGIRRVNAGFTRIADGRVYIMNAKGKVAELHFLNHSAFENECDAIAKVEHLIKLRIASLKKQISDLESVDVKTIVNDK